LPFVENGKHLNPRASSALTSQSTKVISLRE
jgi:hypothetical protein